MKSGLLKGFVKWSLLLWLLFLVPCIGVIVIYHGTATVKFDEQSEQVVREIITVIQEDIRTKTVELSGRLEQFSEILTGDVDFAVKLLVEKKSRDPYIINFAGRYLDQLNLDILEIVNEQARILSSGHWPANYGSSAGKRMDLLEKDTAGAVIFHENIRGKSRLCMQTCRQVKVGTVNLTLVGGVFLEADFLGSIAKTPDMVLMLIDGETVLKSDSIKEMYLADLLDQPHEVKYSKVDLDDQVYSAGILALETADSSGSAPVLLLAARSDQTIMELKSFVLSRAVVFAVLVCGLIAFVLGFFICRRTG
jgi:hypothetical protein